MVDYLLTLLELRSNHGSRVDFVVDSGRMKVKNKILFASENVRVMINQII